MKHENPTQINQALDKQCRSRGAFVRTTSTFADTFAMAAHLRAILKDESPVCLASEDRTLIGAALLAALGGGPPLLLPFSLAQGPLADIRKVIAYHQAITENHAALPAGIEPIVPSSLPHSPVPTPGPWIPKREILRIFTGGTTGTPQSWTKTGANLFLEACFLARWLGITARDHIVATVSPCHIYGLLFSVLVPLVSGASVSAITPSFPDEILRTLLEEEATLLVSVPAHYRALRGSNSSLGLNKLRLAVSSAGMLDPEDNAFFTDRFGIDLIEIYGSTETGGIANRNRCRHEEHFTAFPAVTWKIMARQRLAVRSPYLSPDTPRTGQGYFLTGDRVAPQEEHGFTLLGRMDNITKVGGKRVDLESLRTLILKQAGVRDCVVLVRREKHGREHRILALVEGATDAETIRRSLAALVEPYALPRQIKVVPHLPVEKNGKYDRNAVLSHFAQ